MPKDALLQVRIDKETKEEVEAIYRKLGTTFSEAVRVFAKQSIKEQGYPFPLTLKVFENLSETEIDELLNEADDDIANNRLYSLEEVDAILRQ